MVKESSWSVPTSVLRARSTESISVAAFNDFTPVENLLEIAGPSQDLPTLGMYERESKYGGNKYVSDLFRSRSQGF